MARLLTWGLASELGELTGCRPRRNQFLAVQVAFRPTGQVREVLDPMGLGAERCATAARILAMLDHPGGQDPIAPERTDLILVGFRPEDGACPRVPPVPPGAARLGSGTFPAPKKRRHVDPIYPQSMQDQRVEGTVIAEASIASNGCVVDATVLRSPHPTLSAAALASFSQWRYDPSVVDGKPVPIIMSLTLNFMLR